MGVKRVARHHGGGQRHDHVGDFLDPDRAHLRTRPGAAARGKAAERVDIEHDQDYRQGHDDRLGHGGQDEARDRDHQPSLACPVRCARRGQVREDGQQEQEPGEHVAPLGDPRHRLHAQWMEREEQRRGQGTHRETPLGPADRQPQELPRHEVEHDGGGGVQQHVGQVIAERVHPPEEVVEAEADPGERDPVSGQGGGEHPAEVRPAEAAECGIVDQVHRVVPVEEPVAEGGPERGHGRERHDHRPSPGPADRLVDGDRGRRRRARERAPRRPEPGRAAPSARGGSSGGGHPRGGFAERPPHRSGRASAEGARRVWLMNRDESG